MSSRDLIRPLRRAASIKVRLGALVVFAVALTVAIFFAGVHFGYWPSVSGVIAALIAIAAARLLAHGMLQPLSEVAEATESMARGDYSRRVSVNSKDEVGALARSFNQMAEELARTDEVRRELVANVSHELRTPIAALQVKLENLVDGVEPPDPETLAAMLAQTQRLGRLVSQILDLSRLESGAVPLERRSFPVRTLVADALHDTTARAPEVLLEVDVQPQGLEADGDPERVQQVVTNLLDNAFRYSPMGSTVQVRARRNGAGVRIEVCDEGPGIPDDQRARVFERFYRADSARPNDGGGAGLGLAIARWIVDLHGGDIHSERRSPHGCRMVVTLPAGTNS